MKMEHRDGTVLGMGWTRVPGPKIDMDAYRAELTGVLLAMKAVTHLMGPSWAHK